MSADCADCLPTDAVFEDANGHPIPYPGVDPDTLNRIVADTLARVACGEIRPEDFGAGLLSLHDIVQVLDHLDLATAATTDFFAGVIAHMKGFGR